MESAETATVRKAMRGVLSAPGVLLVASWAVVVILIAVMIRLAAVLA